MNQTVFFVGTPQEVAHHAAPLKDRLHYEIEEPDRVVAKARAGDLAIFYSEHFDRFRSCITQLKKNHVATLYMIDGILEWRNAWDNRKDEPACPWTMRPVLSDKVACIGHTQQAMLDSWGNREKTELVGIPRLTGLMESPSVTKDSDSSEFRILVMSAKCPGFTPQQIETTVGAMRDLKHWFTENPTIEGREIQVQWRLTGDLAQQLEVENHCQDLTGSELQSALQSCDAVITTPSTSMLEAMLLNRPVALLDYHNVPHLVPAAWSITAREHIAATIAELAEPPTAKTTYQQTILNTALLTTENSTQRFADLIGKMLEHAASGNDPMRFPSNLLEPPANLIDLGFDHGQLFPEFESFRNPDVIQLQSQLAHSRREIEHLHGEIEQLKTELGQAHEIFDEIHNHPVAGPIVRIRQRLIDWLKKRSNRSSNAATANLSVTASSKPTVPS